MCIFPAGGAYAPYATCVATPPRQAVEFITTSRARRTRPITGLISRKSNVTGRNPKDGVSRFTAKTAALKRATEKKATEKTAMKNWATVKLGNWKTRQQKIRG